MLNLKTRNKDNIIKKVLIYGRPGHGKALSIDTEIPTPDGFKLMKDIEKGDHVFDKNGDSVKVLAVSDIMHDRECYKLIFDDETEIIADAEHLWEIFYAKESLKTKYHKILTTEEMFQDKYRKSENGKNYFNFKISINNEVDFENTEFPIDSYLLGVWLGDGTKVNTTLTLNKEDSSEILSYIDESYYVLSEQDKRNNSSNFNIKKDVDNKQENGFLNELRELNLINNKHIPKQCQTLSTKQRYALIQGLMDTDGYINKNGDIEISQVKKNIILSLKQLLKSVGIKTNFTEKEVKLPNSEEKKVYYYLRFTTDKPIFKLERKRKLLENNKENRNSRRSNFVKEIIKVDSVSVKCIMVDSPRQLFLASKGFIPTHNSTFASKYCEERGFKPIVFDLDDTNYTGDDMVELDLRNDIKTYKSMMESIKEIKNSDYDTIIIDGLGSLLERLVSQAKGQRRFLDRSDRFNDIFKELINSKRNLIFIGQEDCNLDNYTESLPNKSIISVNSIVNEIYYCIFDEGSFSHKIDKMRKEIPDKKIEKTPGAVKNTNKTNKPVMGGLG